MQYGYAGVSTEDQNPAMQLVALKKGRSKTLFKDEVTGAHVNRPALPGCLKKLENGETLIVWKLDRLGRNLRNFITMLDDFRSKDIQFLYLTEAIETETPTSRAMWQMIAVLAELERSLIVERTRAGVKAAQKRRVKFGQNPKLTPERFVHVRRLIDQGATPTQTAKMIGVSRATVYRALLCKAGWNQLIPWQPTTSLRSSQRYGLQPQGDDNG